MKGVIKISKTDLFSPKHGSIAYANITKTFGRIEDHIEVQQL